MLAMIFNFAILLLLLTKFAWNPLLKILAERQARDCGADRSCRPGTDRCRKITDGIPAADAQREERTRRLLWIKR